MTFNSAVGKLIRFGKAHGLSRSDLIPLSKDRLQQFVIWAGRPGRLANVNDEAFDKSRSGSKSVKVKAATLCKYINGIRCWHLLHRQPFPRNNSRTVRYLIKASASGDAVDKELKDNTKDPVLIEHMAMLVNALECGDNRERTALTIALVAFWGMARLGELVHKSKDERRIKWRDVGWNASRSLFEITLHDAKTAGPGELQFIQLISRPSRLDPIGALLRMVRDNKTKRSDPLFSYINDAGRRAEIPKPALIKMYQKIWSQYGRDTTLTGHSFRVGGASLRWNDKANLDTIITLGRWESKAYQTYLRTYSKAEKDSTQTWWKRLALTVEEVKAATPRVRKDGMVEQQVKGKGKCTVE